MPDHVCAWRAAVVLVWGLSVSVGSASAQTAQRSAIVGRVTDGSGAAIAGARVTLGGAAIEWYGGRPRDGGEVFSTTPIAARLGAAWDVRSDHRTVVRAHYGRYHDMLFPQIYTWHDRAAINPRIRTVQVAPGQFVEQSRVFVDSVDAYPIAPGLKQSHVDQFSAGVEHQLAQHLAVEARYVSRRFANFIGYVDRRLDDWRPVTVADPGPDGRAATTDDGGSLTAFVPYWWPSGSRDLLIDNVADASRRYDAIQVIARRRQAGDWEAQASYTWSRTAGAIQGDEGTNATLGGLGTSGYGAFRSIPASRSPFDFRELKILAWARIPGLGGTVAGGVFRSHNGRRWHRTALVEDRSSGWSAVVPAEEPFSRTMPTLNLLDLRLEKTFPLPVRGGTLGLYLDVMNVLNVGEARSYRAQSGPFFGWPTVWLDPRTMRLGLRCTF